VICAACGLTRAPSDLLVFWPIGRPEVRRYACRPTRPASEYGSPCFAAVVGPVSVHAIAFVETPAPVVVLPIQPYSPAWFGLMREAGVRAA
jgi:hypothetical protein